MRLGLAMCALAFSLAACCPAPAATDNDLPVVKPRVKTMAVFKNGLGFVYKSGETKLADGWAQLDEVPAASLGTLWIGTTSTAGRVEEVLSTKSVLKKEVAAVNYMEILESNVGRKLTLTYRMGELTEPKTVTGVVVSVAQDRKADAPNPLIPTGSSGYYVPVTLGQFVIIKCDDGRTLAISKGDIRLVELGADTSTRHLVEKESNIAKFRVGGKPASAEITVAYLEKGLTWSPSYLIDIHDNKNAMVTLQATLANDIEDLEDTDVSFVVGYPNFLFANTLTPMLMQQSVANFTSSLATACEPTTDASGLSNVMRNSVSYSYTTSSQWQPSSAYNVGQPMPGESSEDLYLYHQPHVTMKKGDRALYTVFTSKVPYEHVYQWNVPDSMNVDDWGGRGSSYGTDNNKPIKEQIWHTLKLQNNSSQPWTTAPAFIVNGSTPAAQPVLDYTPAGGKNTIRLTVATDVRGDQAQTETSRKSFTYKGVTYDNVTIDGTLTVKSFKEKAVKMNVKKAIVGEVLSSGSGRAVKVAKRLTAVNPQSELTWEFELAPGAEKKLDYTYRVTICH